MDKAVEYTQKLEKFRAAFENESSSTKHGEKVQIETGRKFDKVYVQTSVQKLGRYMVDRNSWVIYGIKSWAQINPRRTFGTLDTVDQYDWSGYNGVPKAGTEAEKVHLETETQIMAGYLKRGRPRKQTV
jgi:hypothetical protein